MARPLDTCIVLLHRDLRLSDNPALTTALLTAKTVVRPGAGGRRARGETRRGACCAGRLATPRPAQVVAYIWAPREEGQFQPGRVSRWWLYQSLRALDVQLQAKGNRICYRKGDSVVEELLRLCDETGARLVLFNNVYDPISTVRDHTVKQELSAAGVVSRSFNAELLHEPWDVLDRAGQPHTAFEPFWDTCAFSRCSIAAAVLCACAGLLARAHSLTSPQHLQPHAARSARALGGAAAHPRARPARALQHLARRPAVGDRRRPALQRPPVVPGKG